MDSFKTGKIIMEARKRLNMTQKDLANKLFISDKAVSKWERGLSFPDISVLIPLSEVLELNLYDLLKGEEMNDKKDDLILKDAIKYSNDSKNKLKKFLISIIVIMSIITTIMIGIIIYAKTPKYFKADNKIYPYEKFNVKNYVGNYKISSHEFEDGWVCKMEIHYIPDLAKQESPYSKEYFYNCFNIKYKELPGFNYYHLNTMLNKYYIDDTNYPSYMYNKAYANELSDILKYFREHDFNKEITIKELDGLNLKLIDKERLLLVYNEAINSKLIDSYGAYPEGFHGIFNYEYTSYDTGEVYVVGINVDNYGYIRNIFIDTKNGNYYNSDLIDNVSNYNASKIEKKYTLDYLKKKKDKFEKIEEYVITKQKLIIPEELKDDPDANELLKYNFKVIDGIIGKNDIKVGNIIRYVEDIKEIEGMAVETIDY